MPCPSHPPWLDHSNYAWRRAQVMKLVFNYLALISAPSTSYGPPTLTSDCYWGLFPRE
jgi:hypothetical protein